VNAARGRVAVVTGASAGIGLYTALGLARQGMRVVMVGRDPARTDRARRLVAERSGSVAVEIALADFASLRRCADSRTPCSSAMTASMC
jgi:NAD(P)-dependent dehydrogenase (short-subunit alcohol dehydrogenase family)